MTRRTLPFWLVDVFTATPLSGNSLSVFLLEESLPTALMQSITREMRQFESIFVWPADEARQFHARIFTMEEELPFAGHPVIGAGALLHDLYFAGDDLARIEFILNAGRNQVLSRRHNETFMVEMDQGKAEFKAPISGDDQARFLQALNLTHDDLAVGLPLQVVSTGLPYLIVPIRTHLERARIVAPDFEGLLESIGAKFVYVFDINLCEGRTWDNDGRVEDIATGSAAGPTAAYRVQHGLGQVDEGLRLRQGRFMNRPSEIQARVKAESGLQVSIIGQVCRVGNGSLSIPG